MSWETSEQRILKPVGAFLQVDGTPNSTVMKLQHNSLTGETNTVGTADARITWFARATSTTPEKTDALQKFIQECRTEVHRDAVLQIRRLIADGDASAAADLKRRLPAVTLSCSMVSRAKNAPERVRTHSGWLQCDFDGKENAGLDQATMRARLQADPHVGAVFVGPSGVGIKCALRIDGSQHLASFTSAAQYFKAEYGLTIDQSAKNVDRLCFVTYDPDAWCREGTSSVLPLMEAAVVEEAKTPTTWSVAVSHSQTYAPVSAAEIAEMLRYIPRPGYNNWVKIIGVVKGQLSYDEAIEVLKAWSPEEKEGEYAEKLRSPLDRIPMNWLVHLAKERGYHPQAHRINRESHLTNEPNTPDGAVTLSDAEAKMVRAAVPPTEG